MPPARWQQLRNCSLISAASFLACLSFVSRLSLSLSLNKSYCFQEQFRLVLEMALPSESTFAFLGPFGGDGGRIGGTRWGGTGRDWRPAIDCVRVLVKYL